MLTVSPINGFVPDSGDGFPILPFGSGPGAFGARNGAGPLLTPREGPTDVALVAKGRFVLEKEGAMSARRRRPRAAPSDSAMPAREGHLGAVRPLAFSRDGTKLASGSMGTTVLVWDVARALAPRAAGRGGPGR
jgi:WD40 repeat protein